MKKRAILGWILLICLLAGLSPLPVRATEPEEETIAPDTQSVVEIWTIQQLQAIGENPSGSYILMDDLDMTGITWEPIDFQGILNGNGHAILNLSLTQVGEGMKDTYDGNLEVYASQFAGLFRTMEGAQVSDLKLLGVQGLVDIKSSCFMGAVAGYSSESTITGCTVTGTLELRSHSKMFGLGGLVGYGGGCVRDCDVDVTLICTDTDENTRDEQFLGGILGMGFMDVESCRVTIDGYISDYGYVHSGGLIGMLMRYPIGAWTAKITDNYVNGKITFFECNWDRRAYCKAYVGEIMTDYRTMEGNTDDFQVDERFEYDVELRPEMCETPEYKDTVVEGNCYQYGYTSHMCQICGYTYRDQYTELQHLPERWETVEEATVLQEGKMVGFCACGLEVAQETIPQLEPLPTQAPTEPETVPMETAPMATEAPEVPQSQEDGVVVFLLLGAALVATVVVLIMLLTKNRGKGRYLK